MTLSRSLFLCLCMMLCLPARAEAPAALDMDAFRQIPIQHMGRIKPMESFARHIALTTMEGRTYAGYSETELLAALLFKPGEAAQWPLIGVRNHAVKRLLELPAEHRVFSISELIPRLQPHAVALMDIRSRDDKSWSAEERALLTLHEQVSDLRALVRALAFISPLQIAPPAELRDAVGLPEQEIYTYQDIQKREEALTTYIESVAQAGTEPSEELKAFLFQLSLIERGDALMPLFTIMPPQWELETDAQTGRVWRSPWELHRTGLGSPQTSAYLQTWQEMLGAYRTGDAQAWDLLTRQALDQSLTLAGIDAAAGQLALEIGYITYNPYLFSLIFYGLGLVTLLLMMKWEDLPLIPVAATALITGLIFHIAAIGIRMALLERPPVSTLYESIIFVGAVAVAGALVMAMMRAEKHMPLLIGAVCGIALQLLGMGFAAKGDTFQILMAVLDTNFWLATHVVVITAGYGACLVAGTIAHLYLLQRLFGSEERAETLIQPAFYTALVALLLTAVGTILGGIWADQSWGRFWGWDPKENGALLIVLWLVWLIHGRIAAQLGPLGFMVGMAFLNVVVALAWFGVNLLGVGLHSYGFVSGIAFNLALYCGLEALFICGTGVVIMKKAKRQSRKLSACDPTASPSRAA